MKISTPTICIPRFTFRLDVLIGVLVLYLLIVCLVFGSCLKISFTEGMKQYGNEPVITNPKKAIPKKFHSKLGDLDKFNGWTADQFRDETGIDIWNIE